MSFEKHYGKILVAILVAILVVAVAYYYKKEKYMYDSNTDYDNMQTAYGSLPKLTIIYNPESLVGVHDDKGKVLDTLPFAILTAISFIQLTLGKRVHSRVITTSDTSRIPKGYNGVVRIVEVDGKREDIPFGKTPKFFTNDLIHVHKRIKMPVSSLSQDTVASLPLFSFDINYTDPSLDKKTKNRLPGILVNAVNQIQDIYGMGMFAGTAGSVNILSLHRVGEDVKSYSLGTDISSLKDVIKYVVSHEIRFDIQ
jgi:hypothetical protein